MNDRHLRWFGGWELIIPCLIAVLSGVTLPETQAQETLSESAQSPLLSDPLRQVVWIPGPQRISLGNVAEVNIPAGYHLTGEQGARVILESSHNIVPDDLIGLVASESGDWSAVLEYNPRGFIKNPDTDQINSTKVLQKIRKQLQDRTDSAAPPVNSLSWQSKPVYDDKTHSLMWSLQVQSGGQTVLNGAIALLGRRGALLITSVQPYPALDTMSLKRFAAGISFRQGERYGDYQTGDKVANIGLAALITNEKNETAVLGGIPLVTWAYGALATGLCVVPAYVLVRRRKARRLPVRAPVPAMAKSVGAKGIAAKPAAVGQFAMAGQAASNGHAGEEGQAGKPQEKHAHRNRRRRIFDYPKFYTSVMQELSMHSYGPVTSGKSKANGHANGSGVSAPSNGHANSVSALNQAIKSEIVELIATQKNLIQEQKCLLEQQTRLIEEKRWLIEEQTAFLKGQSAMINEDQYPLKLE